MQLGAMRCIPGPVKTEESNSTTTSTAKQLEKAALSGLAVLHLDDDERSSVSVNDNDASPFANDTRRLLSCTPAGDCTITPFTRFASINNKQNNNDSSEESTEQNTTSTTFSLGPNVIAMQHNSSNKQLLASSGHESLLRYTDINTQQPVFRSKNIINDTLNMRTEYSDTCLTWLNQSSTECITGTRNHTVRLYDSRASRKPQWQITIGDYTVSSVCISPDNNTLCCADGVGRVSLYDLRLVAQAESSKLNKRHRLEEYAGRLGVCHGIGGAIRSMTCSDATKTQESQLATVGLDRFLRVYNIRATLHQDQRHHHHRRCHCHC
jgi:hypothetical protein